MLDPLFSVIFGLDNRDAVEDHLGEFESNRHEEYKARHGDDHVAIAVSHILGYGVSLENERQVDGNGHEQRKDSAKDTDYICGCRNSTVVVREVRVELHPIAGEIQSEEETAKETETQRQDVENEDWGSTLCGLGENENDEEHDSAGASLCTEVDSAGGIVPICGIDGSESGIDKRKAEVCEKVDGLSIVVEGGVALAYIHIRVSNGPRS